MTTRRLVLTRSAAVVGAASAGLLLPEIVRAQSNKVRVGLMLPYTGTFAQLGVAFPLAVYEAAYSPNWYTTYEALGLPKEKWQQADDLWLHHYGDETATLIAGVAETILDLQIRGYRLGVVTSGNESRVRRELE